MAQILFLSSHFIPNETESATPFINKCLFIGMTFSVETKRV